MLGVSARTLQRRLSEEGLTFLGIVARARCDVARRMLDDPARKVIDVALDLGYSDQAHFTRAFVRWTGRAPREFQRLRATGSSGGPAPGPRNPPASWVPQGNAGERPGHRGSKAEKRQELTTWTPYGLRIVALGGPRP
jgi:AraC-like DNA-binding protein